MFYKNRIIALLFLLFVRNICSMDLVLQQDVFVEQDYKCYWVARYLNKCSAKLDEAKQQKLTVFFESNPELATKIQVYKQSMDAIDQESEQFLSTIWDKKINEAYQSYYDLSNGARYQIAFCLKDMPIALLVNQGKGIVSLDTVNDAIGISKASIVMENPEVRILSDNVMYPVPIVVRNAEKFMDGNEMVEGKDADSIEDILQNCTVGELLSLNANGQCKFNFKAHGSYTSHDRRSFLEWDFPDEQHVKITPSVEFIIKAYGFQDLLQKVCEGSDRCTRGDFEAKFRLTKMEQEYLKKLHHKVKHLEEWKALQIAKIGLESHPTVWQRCKDRILLAIPLCLVEGVVPQLLYNTMPGKLTCALGIIPCGIAGGLIGAKMFPFFDSYNSGVTQLRETFGASGVRKIYRGGAFFWYGMLHYLGAVIGNYCLSFTDGVVPYIGIGVHGLRGLALFYGIFSTKQHDGDYNLFGKIAFANPGQRRNQQDEAFTLGDLVKSSDD